MSRASYLRFWKDGNYISSSYACIGRIISAFLDLLSLGSLSKFTAPSPLLSRALEGVVQSSSLLPNISN